MFVETLVKGGHKALISGILSRYQVPVFIAIHDDTLGPPLGGVRMWLYETVEEAIINVLALAKGMTYKAANAGLALGGGKALILADPNEFKGNKRRILFEEFGQFMEQFGSNYITAEDVGTRVEDMSWVAKHTKKVVGLSGLSGDPSPVTAWGVYHGMKACCEWVYGSDILEGRTISIQGCGHVGFPLAKLLYEAGAELVVCDIDPKKTEKVKKKFGAKVVPPDKIYDVPVDIFSPNALGFVINKKTVPRLNCKIIAGGANNQIGDSKEIEAQLIEKGILYAPDDVINAGGLINVNGELEGYTVEEAKRRTAAICQTLKEIFKTAKRKNILNSQARAERAKRIISRRIRRPGVKAGL